jgi:hypothetical protein
MTDTQDLPRETSAALRALFTFDGVDTMMEKEAANVLAWCDEIRALGDISIRNSVDADLKAHLVSLPEIVVDLRLVPHEASATIGMSDVTINGVLEFTTRQRPTSLPVTIVRKDASNPEDPEFVVSINLPG